MKIATVISVYFKDKPQLFERALQSIITQDLADEISSRIYLGIDGPINQELELIVDKYKDKVHQIIRNPTNRGLALTLNSLLKHLDDEQFVFRMDADDYSYPTRYSKQIKFMSNRSDVDILGCNIIESTFDRSVQRHVSFGEHKKVSKVSTAMRVPVAHPTVCFRRRVFDVVPGYPSDRGNEDVAMWFLCRKSGLKITNLNEPLLEFCLDGDFWKRRSFSKSMGEMRAYIRGLNSIYGITWVMIFPVARFFMRLMPSAIQSRLYHLRVRRSQ